MPKTFQVGPATLDTEEFIFVSEYVKDRNVRRALKAVGIRDPEQKHTFFERPQIQQAIQHFFTQQLELNAVDGAWLMQELLGNHYLARQEGKLNASNHALSIIGKLAQVDAFAAEKVTVTNASDVVARLQRGRNRAEQRKAPNFLTGTP